MRSIFSLPLFVVFVSCIFAGCTTTYWTKKYGEPQRMQIDGLQIAVYVLERPDRTFDVFSTWDSNAIRAIQPLEDARRYNLAAQIVMREKCVKQVAKEDMGMNQEGVLGRFYIYSCIPSPIPSSQ